LITARYFSSCPSDSTSRWTPCPPENCQLLPGQRGITPAFGYGTPHPGARGTSTLLNNVLLSTHYGRSDSGVHALFSALPGRRGRLFCTPVSLIHAIDLPTILSPITCACSVSPRHVTCRWIGPRRHPSAGSSPSGNSGLRLQLAGSPHHSGRIEFLIVRTGRSPPAAPHPALRRRSCSRFQVTLTWRGLPPLRSIALSGAQAQANGLGLEDPPILAPTLKGRNRCSCMPQSLSHAYGIACDERYVWD